MYPGPSSSTTTDNEDQLQTSIGGKRPPPPPPPPPPAAPAAAETADDDKIDGEGNTCTGINTYADNPNIISISQINNNNNNDDDDCNNKSNNDDIIISHTTHHLLYLPSVIGLRPSHDDHQPPAAAQGSPILKRDCHYCVIL
ncbi:hypothetical protein FOZ62_004264 [Perkinsus olseni]|uniref:Uncharacterized protein n=1 Tax=Perkinsus olseni TaxID=32597 RepID=A0A7J6QD05_PEROL|nr:hypothetical protein FOZ62_004264 [Perkinsus olseni]